MQQYSRFFNHIPYSNQTLSEYKRTHQKQIYRSYTQPYETDLDLTIYSGSYYCANRGHDIEEVYIEVMDMVDGEKKTILVNYCKDCDRYFLAQFTQTSRPENILFSPSLVRRLRTLPRFC